MNKMYEQNVWTKCMNKIYGQNLWTKCMTNILCFCRQRKVNAVQTCLSTEQLPATLLFDPIGSVRNESTRLVVFDTDVTLMCEDAGFTQPLLGNVELDCFICKTCYMDFSKL